MWKSVLPYSNIPGGGSVIFIEDVICFLGWVDLSWLPFWYCYKKVLIIMNLFMCIEYSYMFKLLWNDIFWTYYVKNVCN